MGNRAELLFTDEKVTYGRKVYCPSVYLHWNGGFESVDNFLRYCRIKGVRDDSYGVARFCQIVGNFFGETLSIGSSLVRLDDVENNPDKYDPGDNGIFWIEKLRVVKNYSQGEYTTEFKPIVDIDMLKYIDSRMPDPLGEEELLKRLENESI